MKSSETDGSTPAEHAEMEEAAPAQDSAHPAETPTAEEPEKDTDKKTGEKRKLEDKEEDKIEAVDAEGVDEEPEKDELDGEEVRARKKSRTDGIAQKDEVKA